MQTRNTTFLVLIASLPILLPLYNPSMSLGGVGMFLGFWGLYVSPVVLFGYLIFRLLKNRSDQ